MRWLIALLAFTATAQAQGPSYLGLCHPKFSCDAAIKSYDGQETIVAGWLENTFASDCKCADRLLQDARPKVVRVHIANGPCMRNKRCGKYEILYGQTAASASREFIRGRGESVVKFKRVLERLRIRLSKAVGPTTVYVSPCLECDLNGRARRVMGALVSSALPGCNLVDNPYRQSCLTGTTCEKHGTNPRLSAPCIMDLDGIDGATIDVKKWVDKYRHCDLTYYWEPWMNCIRGKFIDPRSRNCKYDSSLFEYTRGIICQYFYPLSDTCSR